MAPSTTTWCTPMSGISSTATGPGAIGAVGLLNAPSASRSPNCFSSACWLRAWIAPVTVYSNTKNSARQSPSARSTLPTITRMRAELQLRARASGSSAAAPPRTATAPPPPPTAASRRCSRPASSSITARMRAAAAASSARCSGLTAAVSASPAMRSSESARLTISRSSSLARGSGSGRASRRSSRPTPTEICRSARSGSRASLTATPPWVPCSSSRPPRVGAGRARIRPVPPSPGGVRHPSPAAPVRR